MILAAARARRRRRLRQRLHRSPTPRPLHTARHGRRRSARRRPRRFAPDADGAARPRGAARGARDHAAVHRRSRARSNRARTCRRSSDAFARIAPTHPDLRLVLAGGDGWGAGEVRDAIAASGVGDPRAPPGYLDGRDGRRAVPARGGGRRTRRSRRASGCPRSKRSRAARRSSRRRGSAHRGGRRRRGAARPARRRAGARRARSAACSTTRRSRPALPPGRYSAPPAFTWERSVDRPRRRVPARRSSGDTRMRALVTGATRLRRARTSARTSRACGDDVRRRPATSATPSTSPTATRSTRVARRARPRSCTTSRRCATSARSWREPGRVPARQRRGHPARPRCRARGRRARACSSSAARRSTDASTRPGCRCARTRRSRPITPYGASKVAASYPRAPGVARCRARDGAYVRAFNHTGPGQSPASSYPASRRASPTPSATGPTRSRSAPSIRCATSATCATSCAPTASLVEHGEPGEVYNVCRGEGVTIGEIAEPARRRGASGRCASRSTPTLSARPKSRGLSATLPKLRAATG